MEAGSQKTGAEPSSADGGHARVWTAGFEGSSLLGWKWISKRHNGSLRHVCGVVLKPCPLCLDSFMPSGACSGQLSHAAFLIAVAASVFAATASIRHPSKPRINLRRSPIVPIVTCSWLQINSLILLC